MGLKIRFRMRVRHDSVVITDDAGVQVPRLAWVDRTGAGSSTNPSAIVQSDDEAIRERIRGMEPGTRQELPLLQDLLEEIAAGIIAPIGTLATFGFMFPAARELVAGVFGRQGAPLTFDGTVIDHIAWLTADMIRVLVLLSVFELLSRTFAGWTQQFVSFRRYQLKDDAQERLRRFDPMIFIRETVTRNLHIPWGFATAAFASGALTPETTLPALAGAAVVSGPGAFINHFITRFLQMLQWDIYEARRQERLDPSDRRSLLHFINQAAAGMLNLMNSENDHDRYMGFVILIGRIVAGLPGLQVARILAALVNRSMMDAYDGNPSLAQMRLIKGTTSLVRTGTFLSFASYVSLLVQPAWYFMVAVYQFARLWATCPVRHWIELGRHMRRMANEEQARRRREREERERRELEDSERRRRDSH